MAKKKAPAKPRVKPADNANAVSALKMVWDILDKCEDIGASPGVRVRIIGETVGKIGGALEGFDATNCARIIRSAAELHGITL